MPAIRSLSFILALCVSLPAVAEDKQPAPKVAVEGKWKLEKAEIGGKDISEHLQDLSYEVGANGNYVANLGKRTETGTLDTNSGWIDISAADGPHAGKTFRGLYEIAADGLRICYDQSGKTRPRAFATSAETPTTILMTFKREKK